MALHAAAMSVLSVCQAEAPQLSTKPDKKWPTQQVFPVMFSLCDTCETWADFTLVGYSIINQLHMQRTAVINYCEKSK
eukprot:2122952-Amphidinium_carterae.1